jgi:hypothetical protein
MLRECGMLWAETGEEKEENLGLVLVDVFDSSDD